MNKIIKKQLLKIQNALVPQFDDNTTELIISKREIIGTSDVELSHYYKITIEDYIINEPNGFTLSSNWNGGKKPTDHEMNVEIKNIMGKMVKVNGVGVNDQLMWEGWLPRKGFKIVNKL